MRNKDAIIAIIGILFFASILALLPSLKNGNKNTKISSDDYKNIEKYNEDIKKEDNDKFKIDSEVYDNVVCMKQVTSEDYVYNYTYTLGTIDGLVKKYNYESIIVYTSENKEELLETAKTACNDNSRLFTGIDGYIYECNANSDSYLKESFDLTKFENAAVTNNGQDIYITAKFSKDMTIESAINQLLVDGYTCY